jgi:hypothetical protein
MTTLVLRWRSFGRRIPEFSITASSVGCASFITWPPDSCNDYSPREVLITTRLHFKLKLRWVFSPAWIISLMIKTIFMSDLHRHGNPVLNGSSAGWSKGTDLQAATHPPDSYHHFGLSAQRLYNNLKQYKSWPSLTYFGCARLVRTLREGNLTLKRS